MSSNTASQSDTLKAVPGWRVVCDMIFKWVALVGLILALLQVPFAALGFWGAEEKPGDQAWGMSAFEWHSINAMVLYTIAIVLLLLGLLSLASWRVWVLPIVLFALLYFVQGMLVGLGFEVSRWYGFLHALDGVLIIAIFAWLFFDRLRHPLRAA